MLTYAGRRRCDTPDSATSKAGPIHFSYVISYRTEQPALL